MDDPKIIAQQVVNQLLDFNTWELLARVVLIYTMIVLIKSFGENLANWIVFRLNGNVIKGTTVKVYGETGKIKKIGIFTIVIETKDGWLPIPTKVWHSSRYTKLREQAVRMNRRQDDND